MTANGAAPLLVGLARRGLELQVNGDKLRYRPRSAMTPDLAERIKGHKSDLLAILRRADREQVTTVRIQVAGLIRDARRCSDRGFAVALRDAWRERVAICEIDGGLPLERTESVALDELKRA